MRLPPPARVHRGLCFARLSAERSYRALEAWARERFDVESVEYRWSAQDAMPADGIPYVGKLSPVSKRVWTASGFKTWGITNGAAAAIMLSDAILGRENPWVAAFRDDAGVVHAVSPICTHLYGTVIEGPAVSPLERREL